LKVVSWLFANAAFDGIAFGFLHASSGARAIAETRF
jgi:hypothetical protein